MADVLDFEVRMKMAEEDIRKMNAQLRDIANNAEDTGERMDDAFTKVGKTIGAVFATSQLVAFGKQVVNVRKEIEAYEISFRTLLGSQDKADALFGSLREFAVKTPMQLGDLAKGAQTLLGFGIEAEKIMPTLKQIGDISMGNADKFNSLTLAFAQMSSSGKLMGQDLLQMINAGFNPLSIISQKTGKSIGELKKEMEKGAISVEMVADAFKTATSEGGMFYGMLEKQGEGLAGAIAQLQGAWEEALNTLGERSQGLIVNGIKGVTKLVENFDTLISVILGVASAFGVYKTVLISVNIVETIAKFNELRKTLQTVEAAQKLLNATTMKNPYILLVSAIVGVSAALLSYASNLNRANKEQKDFNDALGDNTKGTLAKLERMSQEWEKMGNDFKAKEQYIIDNKSAFEELGKAVGSVAEAEDMLIKNKDKFKEAIIEKAKAGLYQAKAEELIAKQVENEQELAKLNPYVTKTRKIKGKLGSYKLEYYKEENPRIKELRDENAELQKEIDDLLDKSLAEGGVGKNTKTETVATQTTEEVEKATEYAKKANEEAQRMEDENFQNRLRHEAELARVRGENLEEYYNKEQKAIDNEYQTKVRNIEREREEALKSAKQEDKNAINTAFDRQIKAAEGDWMLQTEQNAQAQETASYKERLSKYQDFIEEYLRIERERQARIDELRKQAKEGNLTADEYASRVVQSDNIALAEKTTLQAELGLTAEEVTSLISGVVTETVGMAIDTIRNQLPALKAELNALKASGADPAEIAKLTAKIKVMEGALNDVKKTTTQISDTSKNTAKESKDDWRIVAQSLSVVDNALYDVMNTFGDMMSEGGKTAMQIMQTTLQATTSVISSIATVSTTSFAAMQAAEKATVILAIISAAVQVITAITQAIVSNVSAQAKLNERIAETKETLEDIDREQKAITQELKKKSGIDYWTSYAESAEQYNKKLIEINARIKDIEATNIKLAKQGYAGNDKKIANNIEEKKAFEEQRTEIEGQLYDIQREIFETMATTTVEEFAKTMAETMVDAFSQGLDGMREAFDNSVDDIIKSMLSQRLSLQLAEQFKGAFAYLEKATTAMPGVIGSGSDNILIDDQEIATFIEMITNAKEGAIALSEEYKSLFAGLGLLDDTIDAESKGFQAMSQDTADELNGRFTALQISGANIDATLREQLQINKEGLLLANTIQENVELMAQIATSQLQELRMISQNTALLNDTNNMLKSIKDNTSRL